jgi:flagellar assembly protein FliH
MSSKIYSRDDCQPAEPLIWPQVEGQLPLDTGCGTAAEAQARKQELQREIERRIQEARAAGVQEGVASAKAAAAAEIKALQAKVAESIAALAEFRPRLRRQAEGDLVKLSLAIARRILHRELAVDPEAMRGLIQAALEKLQAQEICRVRIHPTQEALLRSVLQTRSQASPVQVQTDPSLDRGAAVFETVRGNLDASAEAQLREIEQGLYDRLERA